MIDDLYHKDREIIITAKYELSSIEIALSTCFVDVPCTGDLGTVEIAQQVRLPSAVPASQANAGWSAGCSTFKSWLKCLKSGGG